VVVGSGAEVGMVTIDRKLWLFRQSHNRTFVRLTQQDLPDKYGEIIVKKTFQLNIEGKHRDRVLEATKHEIRKYVKRQRRVPLPEGVDYWDFDCKFGNTEANATGVHFATLTSLIDALAKEGGDSFYLEILAKNGYRGARSTDTENAGSSHRD